MLRLGFIRIAMMPVPAHTFLHMCVKPSMVLPARHRNQRSTFEPERAGVIPFGTR